MNELILATVEHLRTALTLDAKVCDEQPDGQPPPNAGQVYYAVHQGGWTNAADEYLDELCGVLVTITLRAGYVPKDRTSLTLFRAIRPMCSLVRQHVHDNYALMNLANTKLNAAFGHTVNGFVEPLRFRSVSPPAVRGPDWFSAEAQPNGHTITGVSCTLVFERARRVQTLESME